MEKSCKFYSRIPGFKIAYGGSNADSFTKFEIGSTKANLNLELRTNNDITISHLNNRRNFGRIISYTEHVDELYSQFKNDVSISELISFENEPRDALWGERFLHIRDPDGISTNQSIA